jgi:hypothetical protein
MARKINHEIFGALDILFKASKKLERRVGAKNRRYLISGVISKAEVDEARHARNVAFDKRYAAIYRALA